MKSGSNIIIIPRENFKKPNTNSEVFDSEDSGVHLQMLNLSRSGEFCANLNCKVYRVNRLRESKEMVFGIAKRISKDFLAASMAFRTADWANRLGHCGEQALKIMQIANGKQQKAKDFEKPMLKAKR